MNKPEVDESHCCLCFLASSWVSGTLCSECKAELDRLDAERHKRWEQARAQAARELGSRNKEM